MNKKNKIILLIFVVVATTYFFLKTRNIEQDFIGQPPAQNHLGATISDSFEEGPYGEKYQKKLLAQLKGKEKLPKFEDFPAVEFSNNKNIVVDINSDPVGRMFRTTIRYQVEKLGINFAGKYSIAEWGCGSTCQDGAMVDADTGHVYPLPVPMSNGFDSRKNSRLLIQNPIIIGGDWTRDWYRIRYWEWTGQGFKLLGVYKVDLAKKEVIEIKQDAVKSI